MSANVTPQQYIDTIRESLVNAAILPASDQMQAEAEKREIQAAERALIIAAIGDHIGLTNIPKPAPETKQLQYSITLRSEYNYNNTVLNCSHVFSNQSRILSALYMQARHRTGNSETALRFGTHQADTAMNLFLAKETKLPENVMEFIKGLIPEHGFGGEMREYIAAELAKLPDPATHLTNNGKGR